MFLNTKDVYISLSCYIYQACNTLTLLWWDDL